MPYIHLVPVAHLVRRKVLPGAIAEGDDAATMVLGSVGLDASIDSMLFGT